MDTNINNFVSINTEQIFKVLIFLQSFFLNCFFVSVFYYKFCLFKHVGIPFTISTYIFLIYLINFFVNYNNYFIIYIENFYSLNGSSSFELSNNFHSEFNYLLSVLW